MTSSSRLVYSRSALLQLRPNINVTPSAKVKRRLWFWGILRARTNALSHEQVTYKEAKELPSQLGGQLGPNPTSDPPGGAGDREAHKHRVPAEPNLRSVRVGTLNCRTLKAKWRRGMLAHIASELGLDLVMVQEHSIVAGSGVLKEELGGGWTLHYTAADEGGHGGVGVLVSPRLRRLVMLQSVSERILRIDVKLRSRNAHFFSVYSPTAAHPTDATDFLDCLSSQLHTLARRDTSVILGDFNAVLETSDLAPFSAGKANANTDAFTNFLLRHDLISAGTQFRKSPFQLATFCGPKRPKRSQRGRRNATVRLAQLDHVLLRRRERRRINDCSTVLPLSFATDHKLVHCDMALAEPLFKPPKRPPRRYFSCLNDHASRVDFGLAYVRALSNAGTELTYTDVAAAVRSAARETVPLVKPPRTGVAVWESSPEVQQARQRVSAFRQARRHEEAKEASQELAEIYNEQVQVVVDRELRSVCQIRDPSLKNSEAWKVTNRLTGRKLRAQPNVSGDTPEARKATMRDFFAQIVNAEPPDLSPILLPDSTALPAAEDFNSGPITVSEVLRAAWHSRGGKTPGVDEVPVEALRVPVVAASVTPIMNTLLDGERAPAEWRKSVMVAIPKKPGTLKMEEHRGISLMSCTAKTFNKVLLRRVQPVLDPYLRSEQNGFRPLRGTCQQILALRRVIEGATKFQTSAVVVFVDFCKAFDSVDRRSLSKILAAYKVHARLVRGILALYEDTSAAVLTSDGLTDEFDTSSGVLQGDTLAPFLFVLLLDWVLRVAIPDDTNGFLLARRVGRRVPEQRISVLGYADDLALVSSSAAGAQAMLNSLVTTARRVGLRLNAAKTEVLCVPRPQVDILYDDHPLASCTTFVYLGGRVPDCSGDFLRRKRLAWSALGRLRAVFASTSLPDGLRARLFSATVETVLLYNAVTWTVTQTLETELDAAHSHLLRAAFNVHWPERVRNAELYRRASLRPPSIRLREERRRLAGDIIRTEESRPQPLQQLLLWQPTQRQRRGQGRRKTYPDLLFEDCSAPDSSHPLACQHIRHLARTKAI
jgi:exonuclease III